MKAYTITKCLLWLIIFVLALIRYSDIKSIWTKSTGIEANVTLVQQTDIEIGNSLGAIGITIHILLSIPLLVYLCSGRAVQIGGTFISIVSDTLNSWFLIIQVVVTGCDISLYALGTVGREVVALDLSISFMLVMFQSVLRNAPFPATLPHLELNENGQTTLRKEFLEDDNEN